ncbi:hypothetical protein pb186bvf_005034 [Paramecium bursaria]
MNYSCVPSIIFNIYVIRNGYKSLFSKKFKQIFQIITILGFIIQSIKINRITYFLKARKSNEISHQQMNLKQIVDILEDQPYYTKTNEQKFIIKQPVVIKSDDDKNLTLETLRANLNPDIWTNTIFPQYQRYQFTRIYNLCKIIGTLFYNDERKYYYEVEYLNLEGQWEEQCFKDIYIEFTPVRPAQGIRFKGKSDKNDTFHLTKLNILAEIGYPLYNDVNFNKQQLQILLSDYDKFSQLFYLNNKRFKSLIMSPSIQFRILSTIIMNLYDNWLTFQFPKKYKLKQIIAVLFHADKRKYNYEIQLLTKDKVWVTLEKAVDRYRDIDIQLTQRMSALGLRIQGCSDPNPPYLHLQRIEIWAQQGLPLYDQE